MEDEVTADPNPTAAGGEAVEAAEPCPAANEEVGAHLEEEAKASTGGIVYSKIKAEYLVSERPILERSSAAESSSDAATTVETSRSFKKRPRDQVEITL